MKALYVIWQWTWGIVQSTAGLVVTLIHRKCPHSWYKGAYVTRWPPRTSMSLGMFLFVSAQADEERARHVLVHEYGHTIQSLVLGPLYLLVIGLPSYIWCNAPPFQRRRKEKGISYSSFYPERWADRWGEKATGEKAL